MKKSTIGLTAAFMIAAAATLPATAQITPAMEDSARTLLVERTQDPAATAPSLSGKSAVDMVHYFQALENAAAADQSLQSAAISLFVAHAAAPDSNEVARSQAAQTIGLLCRSNCSDADTAYSLWALSTIVSDRSFRVRASAYRAIADIGYEQRAYAEKAAFMLNRALDDTNMDVRHSAAVSLVELARQSKRYDWIAEKSKPKMLEALYETRDLYQDVLGEQNIPESGALDILRQKSKTLDALIRELQKQQQPKP